MKLYEKTSPSGYDGVDSLFKIYNNDEKQLTQRFISIFASRCKLRSTNGGRPLWWWWWALHAEIEMTINLPGRFEIDSEKIILIDIQ